MALKQTINVMNHDFRLAVGTLDHTVRMKIGRLDFNGSLIDRDELEAIKAELTTISVNHEAMTKRCLADHAGGSPLEEQVQIYKQGAESTLQRLQCLSDRLDVCKEMFLKYNVPRTELSRLDSPKARVKAVKSFMRVWREEAKKGRAYGCMSLNEWLRRLGREKSDVVLHEMRIAEIEIGSRISSHLGWYFALIAVSGAGNGEALKRKFREVEAVLGCLRVEVGSGVIVDRFLGALRHMERGLSGLDGGVHGGAVSFSAATENDLVHLILREVLRLEVAFSCPDLPMMLIDEVYVGMAQHLRHVFEKKLYRVSYVMEILRTQMVESIGDEDHLNNKLKTSAEALYQGIKEIWDNLNLSSGAE